MPTDPRFAPRNVAPLILGPAIFLAGCGAGSGSSGGAIVPGRAPSAEATEQLRGLITRLGDESARERARATEAIGRLGSAAAEAVPGLVKGLEDPDAAVRRNSVRALGRIGPGAREAVAVLEPLAARGPLRDEAIRALEHIRP